MSARILCVDDEPDVLRGFQRNLRREFHVDTASSAAEALSALEKREPYAVLVADMYMPEMNGIELLAEARKIAPLTVRIMLTGHAEMQLAVRAMHEGNVFRFLVKPCSPEELASSIRAAEEQHRLLTAERELIEGTLKGAVGALTEILSAIAPESFGRAQTMRAAVRQLALRMNLPDADEIELAAMLAPIGLVSVPPEVLVKVQTGKALSAVERDILTRVPEAGSQILSKIPRLGRVAEAVLYQEKRFDGKGFPANSVAGEQIPMGARIVKVLADLTALESSGATRAEALRTMRARPDWYDANVLQALEQLHGGTGAMQPKGAGEPAAVRLSELRTGDELLTDVRSASGMLLVAKGHCLTETMLERLHNIGRVSGLQGPFLVRTPRP